jgi:hypothetical protein
VAWDNFSPPPSGVSKRNTNQLSTLCASSEAGGEKKHFHLWLGTNQKKGRKSLRTPPLKFHSPALPGILEVLCEKDAISQKTSLL